MKTFGALMLIIFAIFAFLLGLLVYGMLFPKNPASRSFINGTVLEIRQDMAPDYWVTVEYDGEVEHNGIKKTLHGTARGIHVIGKYNVGDQVKLCVIGRIPRGGSEDDVYFKITGWFWGKRSWCI